MALNFTNEHVAHQIADRIRMLIARNDAGDVTAAARRLHRPIADVYAPERLLASGNTPDALDFLATVVRRYDADACWLMTGADGGGVTPLPAEVRGTLVELLREVGDRMLTEVRAENQERRPAS